MKNIYENAALVRRTVRN